MSNDHAPDPSTDSADDRDLSVLLAELRVAIAESGLDPEDKGKLDDLAGRLEAQADENEDDDPDIGDLLEDTLIRFETDHPGVVQTINRIANALSAGGI